MIQLSHVTKQYHYNYTAVEDLSLGVEDGEIVGIIGHNGAGKSTILKMIAGLLEPTSGRVEVMGRDICKESVVVKRQIGYLPEESPLYDNLTARQYLTFFSELYGMPRRQARARIDALLDSLKLPEKDKLTGEFSKGMKRKTAIARTLLHDPALLILDEPNSGLDPLTSFFVIHYLKTLRGQGKTILLSAHNLFHVEYICDRVAIIKNGRLVVFDRMDAIRSSLGEREYQVIFKTDDLLDIEPLDYERQDGNYLFRTNQVMAIAEVLEQISAHNWALVDLSVKESALEEIYVKLMADS
ncbi:MAG: ABC transporter ATP-binding protein [Anaerolineales bacterium]|nr:ABC transporter ATP-binding protein [Anaerolineales bacterium]